MLSSAAFKAHAALVFWRGREIGVERKGDAMGQFGRLTDVSQLPANLDALIADAAALPAVPAPPRPKAKPRPTGEPHPDFAKAIDSNRAAKATFDALAPSHRRDYVEWIAEAKRDETRAKRIETAIEWLAQGKRRNWRYES